jgi:hypothetical protein
MIQSRPLFKRVINERTPQYGCKENDFSTLTTISDFSLIPGGKPE